jgi:hypothetical protein
VGKILLESRLVVGRITAVKGSCLEADLVGRR